ncbi:uncharacterized protein LOC135842128 [Planococcus citri]|uniref:uncharacterized protein LOC135842128 n=1 Tax=Planococcus citri TaxID=170843 RepID=UPI0031F762EB
MSSDPSIYSFEGYDYDNYYSDFDDEEYYMSEEDDDDDDDDDHTYNFLSALVIRKSDPTFLECKKLKEYLNDGTFSDVTIKVEDKAYHLHRVVLSLKSAYFQKLFARNFIEHNQKEIELRTVEVSIFDCIVTYIYENDLESFIKSENMTKLLIALDYLQIDIDQTWFSRFIQNNSESIQMADLFELFNFLVFHSAYPWLLTSLLKFFSKSLVKISQTEYFGSISFEHFKKILLCMQVKTNEDDEPRCITKICAKWICSDVANRSGHIVEIVNAIKYRYSKMFYLIDKNYDINCSESDNKESYIEKKLEQLLNYSVEFIPATCTESLNLRLEESSFGPKNVVNFKQKMQELLNSGDLSDICIKVSNRSFPLHRAVLASKSSYFHNLFTSNTDENFVEFEIEDMDETSFNLILNYIYFEELEITPKENVVFLIKASERFEMKELFVKIEKYVLDKTSDITNIFDLFAYLHTCTYTRLSVHIEKYILENWSKIADMSDFVHVSIDTLEKVLSLSNIFAQDESEILKICSKWITHDLDNRLHHIPSLISSLCRTIVTKVDCQTHIENLRNNSSEKIVIENLNKLLSNSNPVNALESENAWGPYSKPYFMAASGNTLHFFAYKDSQNLYELEDLKFVIPNESINVTGACATMHGENLFVHFNDNYFYAQNLITKRCVSLTSDQVNNQPWRSQLLSCNDSVYLCHNDEGKVLRYSTLLNRWIKVPPIDPSIKRNTQCIFASNGKNIFSISTERHDHAFAVHKYDHNTKSWSSLSEVTDLNRTYDHPIYACFSNQNLFVAFSSFSKSYSFRNRKWITINHSPSDYKNFFCIKPHQNHLIFFVDKSKIVAYNIYKKDWTEVRHDDSRKLSYLNVVQSVD